MEITISYVPDRFFGSPHIEVEDCATSEVAIILNYQIQDFLHATGIDEEFPLTYCGDLAQSIWITAQNFEGWSNGLETSNINDRGPCNLPSV